MKKKIKVLECIRQGQIGGGESHLLSLVENLDRDLYEPAVLSFTDGPMVSRLRAMGVNTHIIHTERPFDIGIWRRVKELLQKESPDVLHAHGTRASSNTLWAARRLGIPVVYTIHGWSFHDDQHPAVRNMRIWGERYITTRTAINIAVSASNRQSGLRYMPDLKAEVINNGIDQRRFEPSGNFKDIRKELGIPTDALLVLFMARFTGHKQPLTLIRAFKGAMDSMPGSHLLMVGEGDEREAGLRLAEELGIGERISFQPFRQDVPDVLAAADVFVLPSLWEGLPIGLLEAMAMGKAVVATRVDGTREIVRSGDNGLLVEPGNITALTSALIEMSRDPSFRKKLGQKAQQTVQDEFNASDMTRRIEKIYQDLSPQ
jgi:glycosyltransferase involved in cell wall biosynthesis